MIKSKSGGFLQRKRTMERSVLNTDRHMEVNHKSHIVDNSTRDGLNTKKIPQLLKQKSISDKSFVNADISQANGTTSFLKDKRGSSTLKNSVSKIGIAKDITSMPMSPVKKSPMMTSRSKNEEKVKLGKFNLASLTKRNSSKNLFQLPMANKNDAISPLQTERHHSLQKAGVSPNNTYYLKTQNKNSVNARATIGKFFKKSDSSETSPNGIFSRQASHGMVKTKTKSFREHPLKSLEKSIGFKPKAVVEEPQDDNLKERKSQVAIRPRNSSKLMLESFTRYGNRDDSRSCRESNYLLPVSHTKQAFKKARGRPVKNSLLRNVFSNQP